MLKTFIPVICWLCLYSGAGAQTIKIGRITADQTWSGTMLLTGDVVCTSCVVTIRPGTEVRFDTVNRLVIEGDASHISLIIKKGGAISALGTAAQPILFTTASDVKERGLWNEIDIMEGINVDRTAFKYCIFECGYNAFDFRTTAYQDIPSANAILIEDCEFRSMYRGGMYITSGGCPTITRCLFHDLNNAGIFAHGAADVSVSYATIYNVSVGLINSGEPRWGWDQTMTVDHVTIDSVNGLHSSSDQWWTGMGIYHQQATLNLTNSILANVALFTNTQDNDSYGILATGGSVIRDYNCYYSAGYAPFDNGDLNQHELEADPRFIDPGNPLFGLRYDSPCLGAASDGTNIGAWQGIVGMGRTRPPASPGLPLVSVVSHPCRGKTVFNVAGHRPPAKINIFNTGGEPLKEITVKNGPGVWDGTDLHGQVVPAGVYFYQVRAGNVWFQGRMIKAD
jgi:hypothetical protein